MRSSGASASIWKAEAGMSTTAAPSRIVIEAAIKRHNGNITQTAKKLAVNPSTIYRKMEKWSNGN